MRLVALLILFICMPSVMAAEMKARHSTHCAVTKSLSIDELVDSAGIIFKGTLKSITYAKSNNLEVRNLEFQVLDPIKGVRGNTLKLQEWASIKSPLENSIDTNQPYVFFFHEPSARGLTSLMGMEQGLVKVDRKQKLKYSSRLVLTRKINLLSIQSGFRTASQAKTDLSNYAGLKEFCLASSKH